MAENAKRRQVLLENYYSGDEAFARFAAMEDPQLDAQVASWAGWPELLSACRGDALLARALLRIIGVGAVAWLNTRPPVLGRLSGVECLDTNSGFDRLKEALMRFPYS